MESRAGRVARGRATGFDGEQPHDLADEQRVPLGPLAQRRRERGDEVGDAVSATYCATSRLAQPAEPQPTHCRLAGELGKQLGQRVPGARVDVPVGAETSMPTGAELAGEEPQQQKRGLRQPRAGHRARARSAAARRRAQEFGAQRRTAGSALLPAPAGTARRRSGKRCAQLGHDLGELRRAGAELRAQRAVVGCRARRRAAPAPTASRPARPPPPSIGRSAPGRRARAHARPAPPPAGSCRCQARRPAGTGVRGPRRHHRDLRQAPPARPHGRRMRRVAVSAARRGRRRSVEPWVLLKDAPVQLAQLAAGLDAELVDKRRSAPPG